MRTKYPSDRSRAKSGLRLNSARDIEDGPSLLDFDGAALAEFTGVGERGCIAVGHRELHVRLARGVRVVQLDHLLEGDVLVRHSLLFRVDQDDVARIRQVFIKGHPEYGGAALARSYGVSGVQVCKIARGEAWNG